MSRTVYRTYVLLTCDKTCLGIICNLDIGSLPFTSRSLYPLRTDKQSQRVPTNPRNSCDDGFSRVHRSPPGRRERLLWLLVLKGPPLSRLDPIEVLPEVETWFHDKSYNWVPLPVDGIR